MTVVVADTCPVIFLAKLSRLALIQGVFPGSILLPEAVRQELDQENTPLVELRRIRAFLRGCRVEAVRNPQFPTSVLSLADRCVLTLAGNHQECVILTDDGLLRRVAEAERFRVAGTLGVLIRARRAGLVARPETVRALEELVGQHRFRISVELYQEALRQIASTDA